MHNAFDMTDDILLDRVFKRFDADNDGYVNREEWILGLSVFLKGTDTERVQGRLGSSQSLSNITTLSMVNDGHLITAT